MFTNCSQSIYIMKSHINSFSQLFGPKGSCWSHVPFRLIFNRTNKNRSHIEYVAVPKIVHPQSSSNHHHHHCPTFPFKPSSVKMTPLKRWATVVEGAERSTQSPPVLQGEYWLWCFSSCEGENHLPRIWVDVMLFLLGECATLSHFGSK